MPQNKNSSRIKNEEQYEALVEKGHSKQKAARIANNRDVGKRGGKAFNYEDRTKKELYRKAKEIGSEGRSKMSKKELISVLRNN